MLLEDIAQIRAVVAAMPLKGDESAGRVDGALNAMNRARNSDRIKAFIESAKLPYKLHTIWSRLRNSSAHGAKPEGEFSEYWAEAQSVLHLFHAMVLEHIGYKGPRTDYLMMD
jgi:hypothetical protein